MRSAMPARAVRMEWLMRKALCGAAVAMVAALALSGCQRPTVATSLAPGLGNEAVVVCRSKLTGDKYTMRGATCSAGDEQIAVATGLSASEAENGVKSASDYAAIKSNPVSPPPSKWRDRKIAMTVALEKAVQEAVRNDLKDPESARFKPPMIAFRDDNGDIAACGSVNSKNSYGGYVGFQPFRAFIAERKGGYFGAGAVFGGGQYPQVFYDLHPMCDARNW